METDRFITRAEINLSAARENVKTIKKISGKSVFAVVKADAYSHGASRMAAEFLSGGAEKLCTATASEGVQLRQSGIEAPIIVLNPAGPFEAQAMAEYRLTPAVGDMQTAKKFNTAGGRTGKTQKIHIEIDTGMGRSGFLKKNFLENLLKIAAMENVDIEGIFTHFACADDEDPAFTLKQIEDFKKIISQIEASGIRIRYRHASNSAGVLSFNQNIFNAVRPGLLIYGISPFPDIPAPTKPLLTLKTNITNVRTIPANTPVGYGKTYTTQRKSVMATLPAGYADGYDRRLSNRGRVLIGGKSAKAAGRICMDRFLVDITKIKALPGDEAVLIGKQGSEEVKVEELAGISGTIAHEFISRLGKRIKRIYV